MLIWTNTPLSDSIYVINTELRYDPWLFSKALSKAGWSGAQQFNVQVILRASTSDIQFDHQDAYFACWNRKVYLHKFTWILAILAFSSLPHQNHPGGLCASVFECGSKSLDFITWNLHGILLSCFIMANFWNEDLPQVFYWSFSMVLPKYCRIQANSNVSTLFYQPIFKALCHFQLCLLHNWWIPRSSAAPVSSRLVSLSSHNLLFILVPPT